MIPSRLRVRQKIPFYVGVPVKKAPLTQRQVVDSLVPSSESVSVTVAVLTVGEGLHPPTLLSS